MILFVCIINLTLFNLYYVNVKFMQAANLSLEVIVIYYHHLQISITNVNIQQMSIGSATPSTNRQRQN